MVHYAQQIAHSWETIRELIFCSYMAKIFFIGNSTTSAICWMTDLITHGPTGVYEAVGCPLSIVSLLPYREDLQ